MPQVAMRLVGLASRQWLRARDYSPGIKGLGSAFTDVNHISASSCYVRVYWMKWYTEYMKVSTSAHSSIVFLCGIFLLRNVHVIIADSLVPKIASMMSPKLTRERGLANCGYANSSRP